MSDYTMEELEQMLAEKQDEFTINQELEITASAQHKFELDLSNRAIFPSILSRKEAKITSDTEICHLFSIANFRAVKPKVSEMNVNKFGIKLLKDNFFMSLYR